MAASGYTPIQLYYSTTASAIPTAGNLANGELAINITDGKIYYKNNSGVVTLFGSSSDVTTISFGTTGLTPSTATGGAVTVAGTLNVANGGTGLTSLTAGYIPFGNGTSAFGNTSNLFWDSANARLGIGTSSPASNLHVAGTTTAVVSRISATTGAPYSLYTNSGSSFFVGKENSASGSFGATAYASVLYEAGAYPMTFWTNATERMRIDSSGNVGIGTSSPQAALHVSKPAAVFRLQDSDGSAYNEIASGDDGSLYLAADASNVASGSKIQFLVDNTAWMTLDSSGNLGLGVTPSAWSGYGSAVMQLPNSGTIVSNNRFAYFGANWYYNAGLKYIETAAASYFAQSSGSFAWYQAPSGTAGTTATFTQAMTLDASGNLGIGTTNTSSFRLNVADGSSATRMWISNTANAAGGSGIYMQVFNGASVVCDNTIASDNAANMKFFTGTSTGSERMRIDSSGNLLVGTTTALQKLTVSGSVGSTSYFIPYSGSTVLGYLGSDNSISGGSGSNIGLRAESAMLFATGGATERMRIDSSGNVGINTTTPTTKLDVAGSSSLAAIRTPNILEISTVSATAATGTINFDVTTQSVVYYTSNASGNFTLNFRGSSGTSLNTIMNTGDTVTVTFLCTNGGTAYYNSAVTIDGSSVTPKWQGGSAPTSGNASSVDVYTYAIVKTGSAAFTVLASQSKFA